MALRTGTSGWQYRDWRGGLYPASLAQRRWLEWYSQAFSTVEVNASFYRLPQVESFAAWKDATPADFVFSVKMSRILTHQKRLSDPKEPVERFLSRARALGDKLGPVLVQLPPSLRADVPRLEQMLECFPASVSVALEPRHESWFSDDAYALMREHDCALCLADDQGPKTPLVATAPWGYLRLHQGRGRSHPSYASAALSAWARRVASLWPTEATVYVYFNNDPGGAAPYDAARFARLARSKGLSASRAPSERSVLPPSRRRPGPAENRSRGG